MPSTHCANCNFSIRFIQGKGWVSVQDEKCRLSEHVTVPHIPSFVAY